MKRIIFLLLSVFMCIALASCGNISNKSDITQKEYDDIREGMTYEEVCKIIGGKETEIQLATSKEEYLLKIVESRKAYIDKTDSIDSSTKEEIKLGLDELAHSYLLGVENNNRDYEDLEVYNNPKIFEYWLPIEMSMFVYENDFDSKDKYIWQGKKINPNAEYRGYAVIIFRDGLVAYKQCYDLK